MVSTIAGMNGSEGIVKGRSTADLAQIELESYIESQAQAIAPDLKCGQCIYFQPYAHRPTNGYCQIQNGYEWFGDSLQLTKLSRSSDTDACPKVEADVPF